MFLAVATLLIPSHGPWAASSAGTPTEIDAQRFLGAPLQVENLTVWPILSKATHATRDYLTLAEAQKRGSALVRERGGGSSSNGQGVRISDAVNQLVVENRGELPILVTAGTVLKGGWQDRQLGEDLVVEAGKTVPVEAYCIERGRWSSQREGRATGGEFVSMDLVASKRVRVSAQYEKRQDKVWRQVAAANQKAAKTPDTDTFLAVVEEDDSEARAARERLARRVREHFASLEGELPVVGFAYAVNGEPIGMRTFANAKLLSAQIEPFIRTMSLEAQVAQQRDRSTGRPVYDKRAPVEALLAMVRGIAEAKPQVRRQPGGTESRTRANDWGGHAATVVAFEGESFPLTEDWTAPSEVEGVARSTLEELQALGYTNQ
jgi:hypothetical protein